MDGFVALASSQARRCGGLNDSHVRRAASRSAGGSVWKRRQISRSRPRCSALACW